MNTQANYKPVEDELREVVARAEELMRSIGNAEEATVIQLRDRVNKTVNTAKARLNELSNRTRASMYDAARTTDTYVRENPWSAVASGAVLGIIVGALIARR